MKDKTKSTIAPTPIPEFTVNYHKHPEVGGMGHISVQAEKGNEKVELSVYPEPSISIFQPLSIVSFYLFPTKATHHPVSHAQPEQQLSPVEASYKIPKDMIPNPEQAYAKLKETRNLVDSGGAGFSVAPSVLTKAIYSFFSPTTSCSKMYLGFKSLDRNLIDKEVEKVTVTNCADSAKQVLEAGGVSIPGDILSYQTPSGINRFFQSKMAVESETPAKTIPSHTLKK